MAPTPQEHVPSREDLLTSEPALQNVSLDGERIVITGMSGLYPQSRNIKELSNILYNKENPITSEGLRWSLEHPDLSKYAGMAPDIDRFDAQFFAVHHRLGNYMDPMSRKILEQAYQAIYDAGLSPSHFNGKKAAVFVGSSFSDSECSGFFDSVSKSGLGILGTSKTMFANRISYWLNTKGPSLTIDESDCSSTTALEEAYFAFKRGACDAAIVAGSYLCLHPQGPIHHGRLAGIVATDGKTKSFGEDSNGYILSDAIGVIVLQKAKYALRVYAELLHVKNEFINSFINDETGPKYGYCRNPQTTAEFIKQFYKEAQVSPQAVEYVEGYGTGVPDADKCELEAIEEVYCEDREDPLLVGSVTSNIGLTEAASGISAITKVLLGYHSGELAANLHCSRPRQDVAALREGRMRVVTEHQRFRRTYVAVNGMSVTGVNSHVLLHGRYKPKDLSRYKSSIPRLVAVSGRQESAIISVFENLKSRPVDAEELALLHNIHANNISGHLGRGYVILDTDKDQNTVSVCEKAEYFDDARRPLWFVYSGMGSQWAGMGAQLMRIPVFAAAIERCHAVLKPKGLDIVNIITSTDKTMFDNILHSFVGIAAVQIGLTDILRELDLKPDGIIGHSVGELGCAYADGCLSAEEMILCAYSRGLVSLQTQLIRGSMAAVGLGYEQISKLCPPEIDVACHNGPESCTISGPADEMRQFVAQLTAKGVFAKEVPCSNIAYHSRYIAAAGPELLKYLKEVIKNPKPRSERWLSTSVPQEKWNENLSSYCSAEYHTNNLLSPVLFEETSRLIPSNAVLVEVAPHGLLQAILKRSLSADCRHVPLTRRAHPDNATHLLQAVGDLYMLGYTPKVQALYPRVQFPVSTGTPMLSHLIEWSHSETWQVTAFKSGQQTRASVCNFVKSIHDEEYRYLQGHVVREKACYPFAAALVSAWDTLAMHSGLSKRQVSVQFRDVHLYAQPALHNQRPLRLSVALHRGTGRFEEFQRCIHKLVTDLRLTPHLLVFGPVTSSFNYRHVMNESFRVASGYIVGNAGEHTGELRQSYVDTSAMTLGAQEIYQLLRDRDYKYNGEFRSIEMASACLSEAALVWRDNWVTLIDGMLQLNMLRQPHCAVTLPTHIRRIDIDVKEHHNYHSYQHRGITLMRANVDELRGLTRCGGVLLKSISFRNLPPVVTPLDIVVSHASTRNTNNSAKNGKRDNMATLKCARIGDLDSLRWVETPVQQSGVAVTVHYAGLNTSDVKKAVGVTSYASANSYGMDFSGTTDSGECMMGLVRGGAASSAVRAQPELLWPVPAHWSLEDAATVPLAYVHALYCLRVKAQLRPRMIVLIHGGAGALGQAAISIALALDCQVFTTVNDVRKKHFLKKLFPQLKDEFIGNSRDATFVDLVLTETKGVGCHIVLSCVKSELKDVTMKCCQLMGTFLDLVQIPHRENYYLGMYNLNKDIAYSIIDFSSIFSAQKYEERKLLQTMLSEGISAGYVRPLSRVSFAPHEAARAFRLLAASSHRGRVLLRMTHCATAASPALTCEPDRCHLMFWDDGALGVQLADRLVQRGATKLYIASATSTEYKRYKINCWRKLGVEVVLQTEETDMDVSTVVNDAGRLAPVEGIYVVITKESDYKYNKEDLTLFLESLDSASRSSCALLKYFAVISSVGAVGQDVCLARNKCGFPGTSLDVSCLKENVSYRAALDSTERALRSTSPALLARPARALTPALLQQLATRAGVNIPQDTCPDTTLQQLGMTNDKIPIICAFLNVEYNISLEEDVIPLLTPYRIEELVKATTDIVADNSTGLKTFFSNIELDELLATADLVPLPTLDKDIAASETEFDVNKQYLYIVPGMEGLHSRFRALCERLKLPALVLQPGLDHLGESVRDTAHRYAQVLMSKTKVQDNFYLLGYETGVLVALELAAILEDHGYTGTVFCVGGAPDDIGQALEEQLREFETEEHLQDAVVRHMFSLMAGGSSAALEDGLVGAVTWREKMSACVRSLLGRVPHSAQYARALIEAALARIERTRGYVAPARALRSRLVLLRAATAHATLAPRAHTLSQRPLAVHQLRTPLRSITDDMQCAAIVNAHLDKHILTEFENKNLCEIYSI